MVAVLITWITVGCGFWGRDVEGETAQLQPPTPDPSIPTATPNADLLEVRVLGFEYWDRFNAYELERVLEMLTPEYLEARSDSLKSDIGRVDQFGIKLRPTVLEEPVFTGEGSAELAMRLRTPIDIRRILMQFVKLDGRWMISFAEEQSLEEAAGAKGDGGI